MSVFIDLSLLGVRCGTVSLEGVRTRGDIENEILDRFGFENLDYYLVSGGKRLGEYDVLIGDVTAVPRLRGGKGGFGSMLRAIGAQIEKTTNREACRDLSGRRLRDINEEQRLKKWIGQKGEREREAEERRRKRIEKLLAEPKHDFKDDSYETQRSDLTEKVSDSLEQGLKASSSTSSSSVSVPKRKPEKEPETKKKKKKLILDSDEDLSSSEGSDVEADQKPLAKTQPEVNSNTMETDKNDSSDSSDVKKLDTEKNKIEPVISI